jgi:hypothetical protein
MHPFTFNPADFHPEKAISAKPLSNKQHSKSRRAIRAPIKQPCKPNSTPLKRSNKEA